MQQRRITFIAVALVLILGIVVIFAQVKPVPAADQSVTQTATQAVATESTSSEVNADVKTDVTAMSDTPDPETVTHPDDVVEKAAEDTEKASSDKTEETTASDGDTGSLLAAPSALKIDVNKVMKDRVIGSPDAPVTIIEYASMTCSHCAHFHNDVLPLVKKELIETGKAKLIFRDFPLDAFALKASILARCAPEDKYFDLVEVIFKNQAIWTKSEDPLVSLRQYGALTGMDSDDIDACMSNDALQTEILQRLEAGQKKYDIQATPTFIFDEGADKFSGAQDVKMFAETVEKLTAGKK